MKALSRTLTVLFLGISTISSAMAYTLTLEPDQWYLISVPGDAGLSVTELFDGQLAPDDLNSTWLIYPFISQSQQYDLVEANSVLRPGTAFFFWHTGAAPITIDIALDATTVALTKPVFCSSTIGCFEMALPEGAGYKWSLIGSPFPEGTSINDITLVTSAGPCEVGCSMQQAFEANLVYGTLFGYKDSNFRYISLPTVDALEAGDGYWLGTAITPDIAPAYLLFPTFCTPFD